MFFGVHDPWLCNISVTWVVKYRFHLVGQLTSSTLHHRDDMEVAIANLKAPNIVKWDIPEKIMQNAFQLYWPWVNRTSHSKVMTKFFFYSWIRTRISCRCNHVDWTTVTKWSVETWFPNEIDNLKNSCATLPTLQRWLLSMTYFCRLSSGSPSPSESGRLGEWGKSMEERESSGIKQQNRQTEIKLLINFNSVLTDAVE